MGQSICHDHSISVNGHSIIVLYRGQECFGTKSEIPIPGIGLPILCKVRISKGMLNLVDSICRRQTLALKGFLVSSGKGE